MNVDEIKSKINGFIEDGKKCFMTSSFQSQSLPLLHIISQLNKKLPVYCINTGYLFAETLNYRDQLANLMNLEIVEVFSSTPKSMQKDAHGRLLFLSSPDYCCQLNKTLPLEPVLIENDVWINGVRRDQTLVRKQMEYTQAGPFNTIRFHPLLDWTQGMVDAYILQYELPRHPLESLGYKSIGCEPCTARVMGDEARNSRWQGQNKMECGLHTDLARK